MTSRATESRSTGFTLIEILVTLVILMIGLLGIAGLMAQGQRASFEAYQRQQALALANDMVERIKANRTGADDATVPTTYAEDIAASGPAGTGARFALLGGGIKNCATADCTAGEAVLYDVALWDGLLAGGAAERNVATGDAIGPLISPRGCIETRALPAGVAAACPACGGPPASRPVSYRVSVAWQGNFPTAAPTDSACGAGTYGADTLRRLVSLDVYTVVQCSCP